MRFIERNIVLCLNGLGRDGEGDFGYIARALNSTYTRVLNFCAHFPNVNRPNSVENAIKSRAAFIEKEILAIMAANPEASFHLVGHSQGGNTLLWMDGLVSQNIAPLRSMTFISCPLLGSVWAKKSIVSLLQHPILGIAARAFAPKVGIHIPAGAKAYQGIVDLDPKSYKEKSDSGFRQKTISTLQHYLKSPKKLLFVAVEHDPVVAVASALPVTGGWLGCETNALLQEITLTKGAHMAGLQSEEVARLLHGYTAM